MATGVVPMALRRAPVQARSRATFERLLRTAVELLDERGFGGLTTNLLAERSGVSVRALYRYFPSKHAVVVELARRMADEWHGALADGLALAEPSSDWRALWCGYLDRFVAAVRATPGGLAVLAAVRSDPALRAVDDEANARYVRDVAVALTSRAPHLDAVEAEAVAQALIHSAVGVIDAALAADGVRAGRLIAMVQAMHVALLERVLEGPAS